MSNEKDREGPQEQGPVMSRGTLLRRGAFAGIAGASISGGLVAPAAEAATAPPSTARRFLTNWEHGYLTAMAETIWPTDSSGPGARVAGVADYIDGQLAGSWGQGHRSYLNGPFLQAQTSGHGWQVPMTPAAVYRAFLPGFDVYCKTHYGNPYTSLPAATQSQAMSDLQTGKADIQLSGSTAFASSDFFNMFRQNVLEGMLSDPAYGGNKAMVGWRYVGFPGDPMRYGDVYHDYIFTKKTYPHANQPRPVMQRQATVGTLTGAAATGVAPANAPGATETSKKNSGGMSGMSGMGG